MTDPYIIVRTIHEVRLTLTEEVLSEISGMHDAELVDYAAPWVYGLMVDYNIDESNA